MASKTTLLDLPNELFPFILQYLRSIDIFKGFYDVPSRRLQAVIEPFLTGIDISQESNEWVQSYLDGFLAGKNAIALRIRMKQLALLADYLCSNTVRSIHVVNWDFDFPFSGEVMRQLRQNSKKLSLTFAELGEISYQDVQFCQSDSQLTQFILEDCVLIYLGADLDICTRLTYLSITLEGMQPLFVFISHLPNLQELKVQIRSQECYCQDPPDSNGVQPCKTLRTVTFTGWIKYFGHLESFFATFGSTIECLSLKIRLMFLAVDGARLEHQLLDKMPRLESLNLNIFSTFSDDEPMQIEPFQTFAWEQFDPVIYWFDTHAQQQTLFTFPYRLHRFECLSNEFVSTCVSNRPVSLGFPSVRILSLINTTPLSLETFLFIEKLFSKITTLELREKDVHPLVEIEEGEEERSEDILSEDLLSNTTLQIPSVTKFCVSTQQQRVDYKTFHRFLRLFPNLVDLELDIGQPLLRDLLKHKHDDHLAEAALARIDHLKIANWHETDTLTDADIHTLFPNVESIIKPEATDFE